MRVAVDGSGWHSHALEQLSGALEAVLAAAAAEPGAVRDELAHLAARIERLIGILEDHLEPAQVVGPASSAEKADVPSLERDRSRSQRLKADGCACQCRLAAARLSDQPDDLAPRDAEIDAVDGPDAPPAAAVLDGDTGELQDLTRS